MWCQLSVLAVLVLLSVVSSGKHDQKAACKNLRGTSGPYLYITTHDEVANILKYSLDGCLLDTAVLADVPPAVVPTNAKDGSATDSSRDDDPYTYYYSEQPEIKHKPRPIPESNSNRLIEYRTMALGRWHGDKTTGKAEEGALFVTDAVSGESAVHVFSQCDRNTGKRHYLQTIIDTTQNAGADHGYGLCLDEQHRVYMSFQHTGVVLRYQFQASQYTYQAMDLPPTLQRPGNVDESDRDEIYNRPRHYYHYFPGTFYQFGKPKQQSRAEQGVRSILLIHTLSDGTLIANNQDISNRNFIQEHPRGVGAIEAMKNKNSNSSSTVTIVKSVLWIANEDFDGILLVDVATGMALDVIIIHNPISLFFDPHSNRVYVSSKRKHWEGAVYAINPYIYRVTATYSTNRMNHPTGIVVYNNILYVAELVLAQVLKFDIHSKQYLGVAIPNVPGEIEHILLSPC